MIILLGCWYQVLSLGVFTSSEITGERFFDLAVAPFIFAANSSGAPTKLLESFTTPLHHATMCNTSGNKI